MEENGANNGNTNPSDNFSDLSGLLDGSGLENGNQSNQSQNNQGGNQPSKEELEKAEKEKLEKETKDKNEQNLGSSNQGNQSSNSGDENPEAVELDGITYKLDKDGNALAPDGLSVFKTKEELDELSSQQEEPFIQSYMKITGVEIKDEFGKPKVYEDTEQGLIEYNKDLVEHRIREGFGDVLNSHPDLKRYYQYLQRGGNPQDYHKQVASSWKNVKFDPQNKDLMTNVVKASLSKTGMSEDNIKKTIKMYEDSNNLESFAEESHKALVKSESESEARREAEYQESLKEEETEIENHWKEVKQTIDKGLINKILIPDNEKQKFYEYLSVSVDKDRRSQSHIDDKSLTVEQWLQLEFLKYKKFDLSKLIEDASKTNRVKTLRSRFSSNQSGVGEGEGIDKNKHKKGNLSLGEVSLEGIMNGTTKKQSI